MEKDREPKLIISTGYKGEGTSRIKLKEGQVMIELPTVDHKKEMDTSKKILINIWDDFYDDGYVPEGKIQETYIYVENDKDEVSPEKQKECLEILLKYMTDNLKLDGVKMWLFFYVSRDKYPNLVGTEHEWCLFDRWEIRVENLTHDRLYDLLQELEKSNLSIDGMPFDIYSES